MIWSAKPDLGEQQQGRGETPIQHLVKRLILLSPLSSPKSVPCVCRSESSSLAEPAGSSASRCAWRVGFQQQERLEMGQLEIMKRMVDFKDWFWIKR